MESSDGLYRFGRWLRRGLKLAAAAAVVGGLVYWVRFSPTPVEAHRLERGEIVAEAMGTGTLEARVESTIGPKIAGRIGAMRVDQGDRVPAGAELFSLDDADLRQQVEIASANIATAQAALTRLEADQAQAKAVLDQSRRNHERVQGLRTSQAVSEEEADRALEAYRVAEAGVARAAAAQIEGQRQLVAAEKNLAYRQALLAEARVVAPFAGLIVKRWRDPGDVVVPGSPTLTLVSLDEIWVSAWVDETAMGRLRAGQPARVVFRSEPERSFRGEVARLGREVDRETREFVVDVRVLALPENWAVGQRGEAYIETERRAEVVRLPARFVQWRDDSPGVYRLDGGRAFWTPVQLGLASREAVEVVEGLEPGDEIAAPVDGRNAILDGRRVAPR